jgi:hypothetical protein
MELVEGLPGLMVVQKDMHRVLGGTKLLREGVIGMEDKQAFVFIHLDLASCRLDCLVHSLGVRGPIVCSLVDLATRELGHDVKPLLFVVENPVEGEHDLPRRRSAVEHFGVCRLGVEESCCWHCRAHSGVAKVSFGILSIEVIVYAPLLVDEIPIGFDEEAKAPLLLVLRFMRFPRVLE